MSGSTVTSSVVLEREQMSPRCGCLAKVDGVALASMVSDAFARSGQGLGPAAGPEDCAVLPAIAGPLLATTDFGPLVGPDLYRAGRIAAAHCLSDVYAMGGQPLHALALLLVDPALPARAGTDVLAGMVAACAADDVALVGGHTVLAQEAMAGLAVIGQGGHVTLGKQGARPGDRLMISKPVGSGMVVRAYRQGLVDDAALEEALRHMETSNRAASSAATAAEASAATDVTGFGLLGHMAEMLAPEGHGAVLALEHVPLLEAVRELPAALSRSTWIEQNLAYCRGLASLEGAQDRARVAPLLDPQTSGGLLVAVDQEHVGELVEAGFHAIGTVINETRLEIVK